MEWNFNRWLAPWFALSYLRTSVAVGSDELVDSESGNANERKRSYSPTDRLCPPRVLVFAVVVGRWFIINYAEYPHSLKQRFMEMWCAADGEFSYNFKLSRVYNADNCNVETKIWDAFLGRFKYNFKIEYLTIIYSILINLHLHVVICDDYY